MWVKPIITIIEIFLLKEMRWVGSSVGGLLHNQGINVAFTSCVKHCLQTTKISPKYPQDTQSGNQAIYNIRYDMRRCQIEVQVDSGRRPKSKVSFQG